MAFVKRNISLTFFLGEGDFGDAAQSTIAKVSGLRTSVEISQANGPSLGEAHIRVHGLTLEMMSRLYTFLPVKAGSILYRKNDILVEAGDEGSAPSIAFLGTITLAPIDFSDMPDTALLIVAQAGGFSSVQQIPVSSYPGAANAKFILENLAKLGGYGFEANDVDVQLATPYYFGDLRQQIEQCASDANIYWTIDEKTKPNTLAIWSKSGPGRGNSVTVVSPDTGMMGYPVQWDIGVSVKTLYDPTLRLGGKVDVQSSLPFANGRFIVTQISHTLQAEWPGGEWMTQFNAVPTQQPA